MNPEQFIECYIAEQNLVGVAIGCASRNRAVTFASTFACFLSRAYDQLRMGAISQTNANFCGSHCGVSIGKHRSQQEAFEKCWAHLPLRAGAHPFTRCRYRYCRTPPVHRCPRRQRQRLTEGLLWPHEMGPTS